MFFISLAYIFDYAINDKYEIESYTINDDYSHMNDDDLFGGKYNPEANPSVDLRIRIALNIDYSEKKNPYSKDIIDNFYLEYNNVYYKGYFCEPSNPFIDSTYQPEICDSIGGSALVIFNITKKVFDLSSLNLVYICNDTNCTNYPNSIFDGMILSLKDYKIFHNESLPFKFYDCGDSYTGGEHCHSQSFVNFRDNNKVFLNIYFTRILYEEKKGISRLIDYFFNKTNNYSIAYIDNSEYKYISDHKEKDKDYEDDYEEDYEDDYQEDYKEDYEDDQEDDYGEEETENYKTIASIFTHPTDNYIKYRRSEIGFMDVIANIGALFSTFNTVFGFIFKFYSKNFDNYKIVDQILKLELNHGKNNLINNVQKKTFNINNNKLMELGEINLDKDDKSSSLVNNFSTKERDEENELKKTDNLNNKLIEEKDDEDNDDDNIINPLSSPDIVHTPR
jgi:hypothetical protein